MRAIVAIVVVGAFASTACGGDSESGPVDAASVDAAPPGADVVVPFEERDLGALPIGDVLSFDIPDRTLGFTILVEASPGDLVGIFRLRAPNGDAVIDSFSVIQRDVQVFADPGVVVASVPQTDLSSAAMPVMPGTWQLQLGDDDGSTVTTPQVTIWVRRSEDGAFHGGTIAVNVFMAPGTVSQSYVGQVLGAAFGTGWGGLSLGAVSFGSLPSSQNVIDNDAELRSMFETAQGANPPPALNVFVVGDLADSSFSFAIGIAGGVPGSPMRSGTRASGVAIAPSGDPAYDGTVLAHETGHLAGLFHTTELSIASTDPLTDTPECPLATLQTNPMGCPDADNVMFAVAYGGTMASPRQVRVIEGSALYGDTTSALTWAPVEPWRPSGDALEQLLEAVWCPHAGAATAALAIAARSPLSRLLAIAGDPTRPPRARERALKAAFLAASRALASAP